MRIVKSDNLNKELNIPKKKFKITQFLKVLMWIVFMIQIGCGAGSDGGGGSPAITGGFLSDDPNPPTDSVSISEKSVQGAVVTLEVIVRSLATASSGAAFDVVFDPNLSSFEGFSSGTFYESGGTVAYQANLQSGTNNRLVVGITQQAGSAVNGGGTLIELRFRMKGIGSSALIFSNNNLIDSSGTLILGLTWSAGALLGM